MAFFIYILCAPLLIASNHRSFSVNEKELFDKLFNTHDFDKLLEIERNPGKFWREKQEHLAHATMSHEDFCAIYTEKAKDCLQYRIAQAQNDPVFQSEHSELFANLVGTLNPRNLWFKDRDSINAILKNSLEENNPLFKDMQLQLYSLACDYMLTPTIPEGIGIKEKGSTILLIELLTPQLRPLSSQTLQNKKRWLTTTNGKCAIFDKLVMLGQNRYLCVAPENIHCWCCFTARTGEFKGGFDTPHYNNVQAEKQERITKELEKVGISRQEYFQKCYNPENLTTNNLIGLCQQTLGCFCNFYEEPFDTRSWRSGDKQSLLFPTSTGLLDGDLYRIIPYLAQIPPDYDWQTKPLPYSGLSLKQHHSTLLSWRDQYCSAGLKLLENLPKN